MIKKQASASGIQAAGALPIQQSAPGEPEPDRVATRLRALNRELLEKNNALQATLTYINQGVLTIDADGRVSTFNTKACELLDLPESLLASHPSMQALTHFQLERGDFGSGGCLVDSQARPQLLQVAAGSNDVVSTRYRRVTRLGRTLEIDTHDLPSGGLIRTITDVTDLTPVEPAHARLNRLLEATQAIARVGGWEIDLVKDTVFWTDGVYRMLETSAQEFTPTRAAVKRFFTPESQAVVDASYADEVNQPATHDFELEMITAKGRRIWVHSMGHTVWEHGRPAKRTATVQDITERKHAQASLRDSELRWKLAMESVGDGMWDWYVQTGEEFYSKTHHAIFGYEPGDIPNRAEEFDKLIHPDDKAALQHNRQQHFDGLTATYADEHRVRCKDGSWKWVISRGMIISRDERGRPLRMIGTTTDISERKKSESVIWEQAHFDALTGLPNRNMLRDRLEQDIKKCKRDGLQLAVLFIDLDHFKEVNDSLGHDSGDLLLIDAAHRIQDCVRESDTVARMGGDEFTVVLSELLDATGLERILVALLGAMAAVFRLGDEQVFVSASIGVTIYPMDGTNIEDLFKNADQALYVAKGAGRNRYSFFTPALQEAAQTRARLANDLHVGLAEQQFRLVFQPIVHMATGAVHKAEALIRWQHPTRGTVSPADFIPIAEATGIIVELGEWVFEQAALQIGRWRFSLDPEFQISINKSPIQFQRGNTNQRWIDRLQTLGLPGASLVVEITEGLLLDTSSDVTDQLLELSDAGIKVSLDDFGTGYSSLSYLQRFDIDFVKIDQSFVRHLIADSTDLALCQAIIVMAHALGMKVIAEGVETGQQRDLLVAAGCDYAQGYLYAPPMSAPDFEAFMARR